MASFLFRTVLQLSLSAADNNHELMLALGSTTIVYVTLSSSISTVGLIASTGNVDGMVVCFSNISSSVFSHSFLNDSGLASALGNRFRNPSSSTAVQYGAVTHRWSSLTSRWQVIAVV